MRIQKILFLIVLGITLSSCGDSSPKHSYREVTVDSPLRSNKLMTSSNMPTSTNISLIWKSPKGWVESKGEGMRIVTFKTDDKDPIECSIVSLGGMAGGLEANLIRWMKQINLNDISQDKVTDFMEHYEDLTNNNNLEIKIFDFTKLQEDKEWTAPSMIAGLVSVNDQTVFIKMTGTKSAVSKNLPSFKELLQSIQTNE